MKNHGKSKIVEDKTDVGNIKEYKLLDFIK